MKPPRNHRNRRNHPRQLTQRHAPSTKASSGAHVRIHPTVLKFPWSQPVTLQTPLFGGQQLPCPAAVRQTRPAQLSGYLAQMRALGGIHLGRLDGQGVVVPSMMTRSGGPFGTLLELHDWLVKPPKRSQVQSMYWHQITAQLGAEYPIVFTHGDIAARNIIVRDGRIVALLDWEFAGWYPEYWEYVFALRGMDNVDWETLGRYLPSLFTKRYNLEYILMGFIIKLS